MHRVLSPISGTILILIILILIILITIIIMISFPGG